MYEIDSHGRPVVYFGNNIAIIKDSDVSFLVVTGLFRVCDEMLDFKEIKYFARSKEEAEEVVRNIVKKF